MTEVKTEDLLWSHSFSHLSEVLSAFICLQVLRDVKLHHGGLPHLPLEQLLTISVCVDLTVHKQTKLHTNTETHLHLHGGVWGKALGSFSSSEMER